MMGVSRSAAAQEFSQACALKMLERRRVQKEPAHALPLQRPLCLPLCARARAHAHPSPRPVCPR